MFSGSELWLHRKGAAPSDKGTYHTAISCDRRGIYHVPTNTVMISWSNNKAPNSPFLHIVGLGFVSG
jgi:hypothetical protein